MNRTIWQTWTLLAIGLALVAASVIGTGPAIAQNVTSSSPNALLADYKVNVRCATTADITIATALNAGDTIDGITLAAGDRVLVKNQSDTRQNGIYVVSASPARASDADAWNELPGSIVAIAAGTVNKGKACINNSAETGTVGGTAITYADMGGGGSLSGTGSVDNAVLRADGTGGATLQNSDISIADASTATANNVVISNEHSGQSNSSLVLKPKGTGAFIVGAPPDGTSTGGNARGTNAIDMQTTRGSATQVASGSSSVAIGSNSTASATNSVAIGNTAIASSGSSTVAIGVTATASGSGASALGFNVSSTGQYSLALGGYSSITRSGMAYASGRFSVTGDAENVSFALRCKTTTNSAVEMALDGSTGYLTIPSGRVLAGILTITGSKSDGTAVAVYSRQVAIKNIGGTTSLVGTVNTLGSDTAAGTSISITANDGSDYLSVQVTGITSETWRWTANFTGTEHTPGT